MPIEKFRSAREARQAQRSEPGSELNLRRMRAILAFWSKARPRPRRPGVFKFRSVEEAQRDERWPR